MDASSIFFGGGTPSILDEAQITAVLDKVDKAFPARTRKIFFEVHPLFLDKIETGGIFQPGTFPFKYRRPVVG